MPTAPETTLARLNSIGPWLFDTADGSLRGTDGERKLEDRAARTLALLCAHRGEIVPQTKILESVWQGRQVSPNSVAVVIGDLRRALADDARDPVYIETIAKRGYRLKDDPLLSAVAPAKPQAKLQGLPRRRLAYLVFALGLMGTATAAAFWNERAHADLRIAIEPVRNDTGVVGYGPLADAMSELLVNRISTFDAVDVSRRTEPGKIVAPSPGLVVQSKLILWNGTPTLSIDTEDSGGHVIWTGMVMGPPGTLAAKTIAELAGLRKAVRASVPTH